MAEYKKEISYDMALLAMQKENNHKTTSATNRNKLQQIINANKPQGETQKSLGNLRQMLAEKRAAMTPAQEGFNPEDAQGILDNYRIQFEKEQEKSKVPMSFIRKDIVKDGADQGAELSEEAKKAILYTEEKLPNPEKEIQKFSEPKTDNKGLPHEKGIRIKFKPNFLKDAYE